MLGVGVLTRGPTPEFQVSIGAGPCSGDHVSSSPRRPCILMILHRNNLEYNQPEHLIESSDPTISRFETFQIVLVKVYDKEESGQGGVEAEILRGLFFGFSEHFSFSQTEAPLQNCE